MVASTTAPMAAGCSPTPVAVSTRTRDSDMHMHMHMCMYVPKRTRAHATCSLGPRSKRA